mgnify:CR=1 FL=1
MGALAQMRKILIPAIGTRSDVQPYLALGLGLQRAGHTVTIASHPGMGQWIKSHGLTFASIGPNIHLGNEAEKIRTRAKNKVLGFISLMEFTASIVERCSKDILKLCPGADLMIVTHSFAGRAESDKAGIPFISVTIQPQIIPVVESHQTGINRATSAVIGAVMNSMMVGPYNHIRKQLNLPPIKGSLENMMSGRLNLVPVSPLVVTPDPRWAPQHRMVGYWLLGEPPGWSSPVEIRAFLDAGGPPVAIWLGGSLSGKETIDLLKMFVEATRFAGVRAIIVGSQEAARKIDLPPTVMVSGWIPPSWLLPKCCALVHYAGFTITGAGLRAGIPAVSIPQTVDQDFWAQRIYQLKCGPKAIPYPELSSERVALALIETLRDTQMRQQAQMLGEQIRLESSVRLTAQMIEQAF